MIKKIKNIKVEEFTSESPVTVGPNTTIDEFYALITKNGFRHLPVMKHQEQVGIISDRDLLNARFRDSSTQLTAKDIMTPNPITVKNSDSLDQVAFLLSSKKVGSALVLDESGKLQGIFTVTDALNALVEIMRGDLD